MSVIFYRLTFFFVESLFFFTNTKLWRVRWLLYSHYFLLPYWLKKQQEIFSAPIRKEDLTYGETPFLTTKEILRWCGLHREEVLWDLGCGRGSVVFFSALQGICSVGVDIFPLFIKVGKLIAQKLKLVNTVWVCENILKLDLSSLPKPNLVYWASTSFSWPTIQEMTKKLADLPSGTKVISLSSPLPSNQFKPLGKKEFWFSWGKSTAYLQIRI